MSEVGRRPAAAADALIQASLLGEVLEHADVAAFVLDEGGCTACNRAACTLTGYEREELLALEAGSLSGSRSTHDSILAGRRLRGRTTIRRKDGRKLRVEWRSSETAIAGMPFVLALAWRASD